MRRSRWVFVTLILGLIIVQLANVPAKDQPRVKKLNPYAGNAEAIKEGRNVYFKYSCNACHGGTGGGGMAGLPGVLYDDYWVYGSDDETLFKLMRGQIPNQTMPAVGKSMTDEEIWKVLAWIRSLYKGDPSKINW
jgi:cytochrome c(L)